MDILPTRPSEVPTTELEITLWDFLNAVLDIDDAINLSDPASEVVSIALAALAYQSVILERVLIPRWRMVYEALRHGASAEQVTAAAGLDARETQSGWHRWADEQVRVGWMTPADRHTVSKLIGGER